MTRPVDRMLRTLGNAEPERKIALLVSAGYAEKRATWHRYVRSDRRGEDICFVFVCDETGAERIWGREKG